MRIELLRAAGRDIRDLSRSVCERVLSGLKLIADAGGPPPGLPPAGNLRGLYKLRFGEYRLVCELEADGDVMLVLAIGHRSHIYDTVQRRQP